MLTHTENKKTPLYQEHLALKARMVPFAGWCMPVQYEGILNEYEHTRSQVSLFDTCHMSEFLIDGNCLENGLDHVVTQSICDMPLKTCRYGLMLHPSGGIVDDLVVYRLDIDRWMIVANAGTIDKDFENLRNHISSSGNLRNISEETGKIDVQGPLSRDVLKTWIPGIEKLKYFTFDIFPVLGEKCIVSRTGYTGELGFEIYFPAKRMTELWRELLKNPIVKSAGLGVRDVLRLEMGYSLYGNDLDDTISPLEAGLERFIDFQKSFIGQEALFKQQQSSQHRRMISFVSLSRRSPRHLQKVFFKDFKEIGFVTSGTFSPHLKKGVGLGLVKAEIPLGEKIFFGDDKIKEEAEVTLRPFYRKGSLKH